MFVYDYLWCKKRDAAGKIEFLPIQKIVSAVSCQLTSGDSSMEHNYDKNCMAASTGLEAVHRFCKGINAVYSKT